MTGVYTKSGNSIHFIIADIDIAFGSVITYAMYVHILVGCL